MPRAHPGRSAVATALAFTCLAVGLGGCEGVATGDRVLDLPVWTVEPELEVGTLDGDVVLGHVTTAQEGPDGTLHVIEWGQARIQRFGPDGTPLPSLGRAGSGPGEFNRPTSLGWDGEGLWVLDGGANRITWFEAGGSDASGRVIRSVVGEPVVLRADEATFRLGPPLGDGSFRADRVVASSMVAEGSVTEAPILRVDADQEPMDTLAIRTLAGQSVEVTEDRTQGAMYTTNPFPDVPIRQVITGVPGRAAEVVLVDWTLEPEPVMQVVRRTLTGDTLAATSLPYEPVPVTEDLVMAHVDRIARSYAESPFREISPARARDLVRESLDPPSHFAPVRTVHPGPDGSLWLELAHPDGHTRLDEGVPDRGLRWLVLDGSGEPQRLVELPPAWSLQWVGPAHLWAVRTDELGVNYLVRARLVEAGPPD